MNCYVICDQARQPCRIKLPIGAVHIGFSTNEIAVRYMELRKLPGRVFSVLKFQDLAVSEFDGIVVDTHETAAALVAAPERFDAAPFLRSASREPDQTGGDQPERWATMKPTQNIALQTEHAEQALEFYQRVLGLELKPGSKDTVSLGPVNLIVDQADDLRGPVFEFVVDDLDATKERLLQEGCEIVRWEGRGGCCFMRDPHGLCFNLWQD